MKGNKYMFTCLHTRIDQSVYFVNVMDKKAKSSPFLQNKIEFEDWNIHDWRNLYAFKNVEAWIQFMYAIDDLARFYNRMNKKNYRFELYFKSYSKENIDELKEDAGRCVRDDELWNEIVKLVNEGYIFCYFTTQRECHDPNHFLGYMMSNFYYDRSDHGHMTYNDFVEDNTIVPIITDEKW
jgi:hypothetical protein